jgi:MurNAc alpha-1-phosphate uridylyltransferase
LDGTVPALTRLAEYFDPEKMDVLLLIMPLKNAHGFGDARGDYDQASDGRLMRLGHTNPKPYVYISAQIIKPKLYDGVDSRFFSNLELWDQAERLGRLYGLVHDGFCYHVGTPADLQAANHLLESGQGW